MSLSLVEDTRRQCLCSSTSLCKSFILRVCGCIILYCVVLLYCPVLYCLVSHVISSRLSLCLRLSVRVSLSSNLSGLHKVSQTSLVCTGSILNPKPSTQALSWTCHTRSSSIPTRLLGLVASFLSIRVEKSPNPLDRSARHRRPTTRRCKRLSAGRFVQTLNPHPLASVLSDSRA